MLVMGLVQTVITYDYDPLYRLTAADYSNGDYYHYTYDAVGNRLTQSTMVNGLSSVVEYVYDDANRLASVNGVTYTWDANGNLLNDGVNTYTYDSANRLKSITGASTANFGYSGLGDRLSQNGVNYTLDLNAGLTQVLSDGTNTYLYGVGRIAQVNAGTEYFLGDALGSVRQLTNTQGNVTLTKSYAPYGEVMASAGSGTSPFAYTGEQTDSSGLTYLRARYYASSTGRFLTRDTWDGDVNRPISFNRWNYVEGNPINLTDPSGHSPLSQNPCDGQPNYEICYARWIVSNGGELTEDIIKSIYNQYPDETLQLIQQQFDIKLPAGYSFRMALGGTAFTPNQPYEKIFGVNWWFTRYNYLGTMFEFSDYQCGVFSSEIPAEALHIDYSIYITKHTFSYWKYSPDDLAGIMIHEATHAWQESVASSYVVAPGQKGDPSSYSWFNKYQAGIERQAVDIALDADDIGRIHISSDLRKLLQRTKDHYDGGWFGWGKDSDFPYPLPPNVP